MPQDDEVLKLAMSPGLLLNIIDIFDRTEIEMQRDNFINAYQCGDNWECFAGTANLTEQQIDKVCDGTKTILGTYE